MKSLKTFFYALKQSLFNPSYYRDVAKTRFGFSMKYLWFLLMIIIFIKTIFLGSLYVISRPQIIPGINRIMNYAYNFYPKNLQLKLTNGQLSTNVREPYIFDLEEQEKWNDSRHFLIIDTRGSIEDYPNYNSYILATKNAVVYPSKSNSSNVQQTSVFYFRDFKQNFTLNKNIYDDTLNKVRPYTQKAVFFIDWLVVTGLLFFLFFGSLFWTIGVTIGLVFLTLVVWVLSKIIHVDYSYSSLYKLGMHGVTWPIIGSEIMKYFKTPFPHFFNIVFILWMIIVLVSLKEPKTEVKTKLIAKKAKKPRKTKK